MKKLLLPLAAVLLLAGCGTSPKNVVAGLEEGLAAADRLAIEYVSLPACETAPKPFCSETSAVQNIEVAKNVAKSTVLEAEAAVFDPNMDGDTVNKIVAAAAHALAAFRAAVPSLTGAP